MNKFILILVFFHPDMALAGRGASYASAFAFIHFLFLGVIGVVSFLIGFKLFPNAKVYVQISLGFLIGSLFITFLSGFLNFLMR